MKLNPSRKLLLQIGIIFLVQLMFKGFDLSFGGFFDFTFRGFVFTGFFVIFWLIIWRISSNINDRLNKKPMLEILIVNLLLGFSGAFSTNLIYRYGDVKWFGNEYLWQNNSIFNPELTVSLLLIYLLAFGFDQYFKSSMRIKEKELNSEKLRKENALAKYMSLKAQIEPHFLFNSLSVLSSLVREDVNLAEEYIVKLSRCLRYIIEQNEYPLVRLSKEISFVNDYYFLIKTRYNEGIVLKNKTDVKLSEEILIPPATLQLLIENAILHNKHSIKQPLEINIYIENNRIIICNTLNRRKQHSESTGTGLENIRQRFDLLTKNGITVNENSEYFVVSLPVLMKMDYENFNY